jgi:hypothetical protein
MNQLDTAAGNMGMDLGGPGYTREMSDTSATSKTGGIGALTERYLGDNPEAPADQPAWALARGGVKSIAQVGSTALNIANKIVPNAQIKAAADWLHQGSQPDGFWEKTGAIGEQVLEYLTGNALFKLAGPAIESTATGARVVSAVKQAKGAQQIGEVLAAHPRLAGIVAQGLMQGAQTYAHSGDPTQAAAAGVLGAGMQAGAEGVAAGGRHLVDISPGTIKLAGEDVPVMRSQLNAKGHIAEGGGAEMTPKMAAQQQAAGPGVIKNLAQQATAQAIDRINATRPMFPEQPRNLARILGAGEDAGPQAPAYAYSPSGVMSKGAAPAATSEPFTFTLEGPGTTEGTTGELTHEAEPIPRTHTSFPAERTAEDVQTGRIGNEPQYIKPGDTWAERQGTSWVERRIPGFMHAAGDVEGAEDVAKGGGTLQTTSPAEAQSWLRQLEEIQASKTHAELTPAQQAAIETKRQSLQEQLGIYYSSPYAQRFVAENPWDAMEHVRHFGDAADQLEATAQPVFQTLDRVSDGQFAKFRDAAKQAQKVMENPQSIEARESAEQRFNEANGKINDLIDRHSDAISRADYTTAKTAWRESSRLNELHANVEGMMNGVTADQSDEGLDRVMVRGSKQLGKYLETGTNRQQIEQLIGREGVNNLTDLSMMMSQAKSARAATGILKNVLLQLRGHATTGGMVGGALAHVLGADWKTGATVGVAGALTTDGMRWLLRDAATDPRIGRAISYAARNGIRPQVYAPLIARMIAVPFQEQQEQQPEEQPAGAQK